MAWTDKLAAFTQGAASMAPTAMRLRGQRHQEQRQIEQDELTQTRYEDAQQRHEDVKHSSLVDDLFRTAEESLSLETVKQVENLDPARGAALRRTVMQARAGKRKGLTTQISDAASLGRTMLTRTGGVETDLSKPGAWTANMQDFDRAITSYRSAISAYDQSVLFAEDTEDNRALRQGVDKLKESLKQLEQRRTRVGTQRRTSLALENSYRNALAARNFTSMQEILNQRLERGGISQVEHGFQSTAARRMKTRESWEARIKAGDYDGAAALYSPRAGYNDVESNPHLLDLTETMRAAAEEEDTLKLAHTMALAGQFDAAYKLVHQPRPDGSEDPDLVNKRREIVVLEQAHVDNKQQMFQSLLMSTMSDIRQEQGIYANMGMGDYFAKDGKEKTEIPSGLTGRVENEAGIKQQALNRLYNAGFQQETDRYIMAHDLAAGFSVPQAMLNRIVKSINSMGGPVNEDGSANESFDNNIIANMIDSKALTQDEREQLANDMSDWIVSSYPGSEIAAQAAQSVLNAAVERDADGVPGVDFPTIRQKENAETVLGQALGMVDKMLQDGLNEEEINARLTGDGETHLGIIGGLQRHIDEGILFYDQDDIIQLAIEDKIAGALEKRAQSAEEVRLSAAERSAIRHRKAMAQQPDMPSDQRDPRIVSDTRGFDVDMEPISDEGWIEVFGTEMPPGETGKRWKVPKTLRPAPLRR